MVTVVMISGELSGGDVVVNVTILVVVVYKLSDNGSGGGCGGDWESGGSDGAGDFNVVPNMMIAVVVCGLEMIAWWWLE